MGVGPRSLAACLAWADGQHANVVGPAFYRSDLRPEGDVCASIHALSKFVAIRGRCDRSVSGAI